MSDAPMDTGFRSHIVMPRNFGFLPRIALFFPEGENGGAGTNAEEGGTPSGSGNAGEEGGESGETKKNLVTLERHKEVVGKKDAKISDLEAKVSSYEKAESERAKSEMTESERTKAEKEELLKENQVLKSGELKRNAMIKATKALKDSGKVIDPEKEDALMASIDGLAFNETTMDATVASLVNLAAMPKGSGYKSKAGTSSKGDDGDRDPRTYSGNELKEIYNESPERYNAVMAQRKQLAASDKAKKGKK